MVNIKRVSGRRRVVKEKEKWGRDGGGGRLVDGEGRKESDVVAKG